jgi:hypothetical protein
MKLFLNVRCDEVFVETESKKVHLFRITPAKYRIRHFFQAGFNDIMSPEATISRQGFV